mmetsp:Transcript_18608/g.37687  ORF Transcript_18608/g.37687 Transcript_18608/m.37687 type:complete len:366 (-) Transcript_18608:226-1323(-)
MREPGTFFGEQCLLEPPEAVRGSSAPPTPSLPALPSHQAWLDYEATCRCEFFSLSRRELLQLASTHLSQEQRVQLAQSVLDSLIQKARKRLWSIRLANGLFMKKSKKRTEEGECSSMLSSPQPCPTPQHNDETPGGAPGGALGAGAERVPGGQGGGAWTRLKGAYDISHAAANVIEVRYLAFALESLKQETVASRLPMLAGVTSAGSAWKAERRASRLSRATTFTAGTTFSPRNKAAVPAYGAGMTGSNLSWIQPPLPSAQPLPTEPIHADGGTKGADGGGEWQSKGSKGQLQLAARESDHLHAKVASLEGSMNAVLEVVEAVRKQQETLAQQQQAILDRLDSGATPVVARWTPRLATKSTHKRV